MLTIIRQAQLIRQRIYLRLASTDPIVGTVFGALFMALAILAMSGR